jgi:hypothetical protein
MMDLNFPNDGRVPVAGLQHRLPRLRRHDDDRRGADGQGRLELGIGQEKRAPT